MVVRWELLRLFLFAVFHDADEIVQVKVKVEALVTEEVPLGNATGDKSKAEECEQPGDFDHSEASHGVPITSTSCRSLCLASSLRE